MHNLNDIFFEAIKLVLAGIIGGLIGARANDKFTRAREKESGIAQRKRDFIAYIRQWRSEIELAERDIDKWGVNGIIKTYQLGLPSFNAGIGRVQPDFRDRKEFNELTSRINGLTAQNLQGQTNPRAIILEAIDALLRFLG